MENEVASRQKEVLYLRTKRRERGSGWLDPSNPEKKGEEKIYRLADSNCLRGNGTGEKK